jgi:hypothetical protein
MKPEDDPEFMEFVEETILDLSPAELAECEIIAKDLGVDPVVEALRPIYEQYLQEEG